MGSWKCRQSGGIARPTPYLSTMTTASPPTKPPLPLGNKLLFSADHIGLQAIGYPRQQWVLFFLAPPALEGISRVPDVSLVGLNIDARVLAGLSTRLPTPSSVGGATAPAAGGGVAYPSSCSARRFMLCWRGWSGFYPLRAAVGGTRCTSC